MKWIVLALVLLAAPAQAQEPVVKWADYTSWGTAPANAGVAFLAAVRGENRWCRLAQLGVSEGIANGGALLLKHYITSARPCLGCAADGMPSGHSANSFVGARGWGLGIAVSTPVLRVLAHRHTKTQVLFGSLLGIGAEYVGQLIPCGE